MIDSVRSQRMRVGSLHHGTERETGEMSGSSLRCHHWQGNQREDSGLRVRRAPAGNMGKTGKQEETSKQEKSMDIRT